MSDLQKLAMDVSDKCCNWLQSDDDPITTEERKKCAQLILSALEQAYAQGYEQSPQLVEFLHEPRIMKLLKSQQPRGEPWIVRALDETGKGFGFEVVSLSGKQVMQSQSRFECDRTAAAHNASISNELWTEETVKRIIKSGYLMDRLKAIAAAHNASIGAPTGEE